MKKKIIVVSILLLMFFLWSWSKNGISPKLVIKKQHSIVTIFFDNYLIGQVKENISENKSLHIDFKYQDLESKYFVGQSKTEVNDIFLPADNYEKTIKVVNPFAVRLNFVGKNSFYNFYFNPYRHLNSDWEDPENILIDKTNLRVKISLLNGIKWILWLMLKPFPYLFPIFLLLLFVKKAIPNKKIDNKKTGVWFYVPIIILMLISFFWSRFLMKNFLNDAPHVPDSVSYILLSKIISTGKLTIPFSDIPQFIPTKDYSQYFYHWFVVKENFIFVPYLLGHPIILSLGKLFGLLKFVPPLIGSLNLFLVFFIVLLLSNSFFFSLLAAVLLFLSPFFQTQTIDYMSHNTAAFYLLLSILPLFLKRKNSFLYLLTGFFQGLLLNTRPLTFAVTFVLILFFELIKFFSEKNLKKFIKKMLFITSGFVFPFLLFLFYNKLTTNNIFVSPYLYHGILGKIIFGSGFKINYGLLHGFSNLAVMSLFFLKNYYLSFLPLLISILLLPFYGKNLGKVIFLQLLAIGIICVWMLYDGNFFMYGPRLIYEAIPILSIVYGVVFYYLYQLTKNKFVKAIVMFFIIFYFFQITFFELSWLGIRKAEYSGIVFVPSTINELRNFNSVDGKFIRLYQQNIGRKKIFLMKQCVSWWCHGEGIWLNEFPLNKSKPLFLILPDDYRNEIPETEIISWQ